MSTSSLVDLARSTDHLDGTGVVAELEDEIRRLTGFPHVLGMSSASTALAATYAALGLGPGDEVIMPSLTAAETAAPLLRAGCTIVFADIEPDAPTLGTDAVEHCLTNKTKAVVGVDLFGLPHDTAGIRGTADRVGVAYVADCSQGFGARRDGLASGYAADAVILSLNAQKDLAAGEGGVLLTRSRDLYESVLRATQHPRRQERELGPDRVNELPINGRLNPLAAAVSVQTLPEVLDRIAERRRRAPAVIELLNASGLVDHLSVPEGCERTYPCFAFVWRFAPRPVELLGLLFDAGFSARLRDLPVRPLHGLTKRQFPGQVRVPYSLVHTERLTERGCCLEVL